MRQTVLFLDEIAFTETTHMTRTWSPRRIHIQVNQHQVYTGYRSVTATVCPEKGVILLEIVEEIPTKESFAEYLTKLSLVMRNEPFFLFMDKASVHTANMVYNRMGELNITPIFNITASPDYNPIEAVFSFCKGSFRRARLNALANKREFDLDINVRKCFDIVTPELVRACFMKSYFLLKNA